MKRADITTISIIILAIVIFILFLIPKTGEVSVSQQLSAACSQYQGQWNQEQNECETQNSIAKIEEFCTEYKGTFNECASPCRHRPESEFCATVCVQVCSF